MFCLKQRRIIKSTRKYERDSIEVQRADDPEQIFPLVEKLASRYHLQYRFIPAEGYAIDENKVRFIEKQKSLEQKVSSVIAIGGLLSSFFLLGSSVTGNAIGNLGKSSGSWLGIGLFLVGIAGVFWYFRSKKR